VIVVEDENREQIRTVFESGVRSKCVKVGWAAYGLGILYFVGFFGEDLRQKSFALFRAAVFAKCARAEVYLAFSHFVGIGTDCDQDVALAHLSEALGSDAAGGRAVVNNFIGAKDSLPFPMFLRLEQRPVAMYLCWKFMDRLGCADPGGRDKGEFLARAKQLGFAR
jgi:hypothetical protein